MKDYRQILENAKGMIDEVSQRKIKGLIAGRKRQADAAADQLTNVNKAYLGVTGKPKLGTIHPKTVGTVGKAAQGDDRLIDAGSVFRKQEMIARRKQWDAEWRLKGNKGKDPRNEEVTTNDSVTLGEVKYKPMPGTLNYGVNGDDPSRYMGAAKPLMQRKTDARGNLIRKPKRDMSGMTTSAAIKMAKDLIKTLTQKAPNNTSIEVIGSSDGKTYSFYIRRGKISGQDVWVAAKSGNRVELNAAGTGLQVVDAKSRRVILDRGTDVYWN